MKKLWCRGKGDFCHRDRGDGDGAICGNCKYIDGTGAEYREVEEQTKTNAKANTKTNVDRLRAMTDYELALFLARSGASIKRAERETSTRGMAEMYEWLQQPVEGVETV